MRIRTALALSVLLGAGCGSPAPGPQEAPSAPPIAAGRNRAAPDGDPVAAPDPRCPTRVLGHVEGEVITYREMLQAIGPELAQTEDPDDRARKEDRELVQLVRKRLLYRAAVDNGVKVGRDEIDEERTSFVKELARNGGTLEAFLHEREMTRREFDEMLQHELVVGKYQQAAIGRNNDRNVRVRPTTDNYVSPEQVSKYYDRHPEKWREPASARCRLLAVKADLAQADRVTAVAAAKAKAEAVLLRLKAGDDWVPVYREAMRGEAGEPDTTDGLMDFPRGEKAEWIEDFAFKSAKGTLSEVVQKGTTFYVLKAEGWHEDRSRQFADVSDEIRAMLTRVGLQVAALDVELTVLDESSVRPESLRAKVRDVLRAIRHKLIVDSGQ